MIKLKLIVTNDDPLWIAYVRICDRLRMLKNKFKRKIGRAPKHYVLKIDDVSQGQSSVQVIKGE